MKCTHLIIIGLVSVCTVSARVINVPQDYPTIQAAINAAVDADEIIVDAGTYIENIDFSGKNITVRSASGRDETIIDGDASGSTVLIINEENENAILDGFTITNGSGWYNGQQLIGGGILVRDGSSPTLRNLTITNNTAVTGDEGSGGGICISYGSTPSLDNIIVSNNTAGWGGGMAIVFASPTLNDVKIVENNANTTGGGMYIGDYSHPTIERLTVTKNIAEYYAGGIFLNNNSYPNLYNLTVAENECSSGGGGMVVSHNSHPFIVSSIFWWNEPDQILLYDLGEFQPNTITVSFSDIQDGWWGIGLGDGSVNWIEGNSTDDPLFIYNSCPIGDNTCTSHPYHEDNYNLLAGSPCIGTGADGVDMGAGEYCLTLTTDPTLENLPQLLELYQNFPNPFNPSTSIKYNIVEDGLVTLVIFDLKGQEIATLAHGQKTSGLHTITWLAQDQAGNNLEAGIYLYKMIFTGSSGDYFQSVRKFTLLK